MKMTEEQQTALFDTVAKSIKNAWMRIFNKEIEVTKDIFTDDFVVCVAREDVFIEVSFASLHVVYDPGYIKHYPGVRYYADGSGEPPSEEPEYLIDGGTSELSVAVTKIICHQVDVMLDDLWLGECEQEMDDAMEGGGS